ncbi:MAG: 4Fe-4S binding protein [Bacteroidales bacterium]
MTEPINIIEISKVNTIYFSATMTTKRVVDSIAAGTGIEDKKIFDITSSVLPEYIVGHDEIAIFGIPVYAGRVPKIAAERIKMFKGEGSAAIIVAVYGNRDFDDALVELYDIVTANGFRVISGGAFIAKHSIFPKVGAGRPDKSDLEEASQFGTESMKILYKNNGIIPDNTPIISGNRPYKPTKSVPFYPKAGRKCNKCGVCAAVCPVGAIDKNNIKKCDKELCIACAHCIAVCPQKSRKFGGILYRIVSYKFGRMYSEPRKPYMFYNNIKTT